MTIDPRILGNWRVTGTVGRDDRPVRFDAGRMLLAPPRRLWAGVMQHQELTWGRLTG